MGLWTSAQCVMRGAAKRGISPCNGADTDKPKDTSEST